MAEERLSATREQVVEFLRAHGCHDAIGALDRELPLTHDEPVTASAGKRKAPASPAADDGDDDVADGDGGKSRARVRSSDDDARRQASRLLRSARRWPFPQVVATTFDAICDAPNVGAERALWARVLGRPIPSTWDFVLYHDEDNWPVVRAGTSVKGVRGGPPPDSGTHVVLNEFELQEGTFKDSKLYNGVRYGYMDEPTSESDANHVDSKTGEHRFFALQSINVYVRGRVFGSVERRRLHWPLEPPYEDGPIEWYIGARAGYQDREGTSAGRADKWHLGSG